MFLVPLLPSLSLSTAPPRGRRPSSWASRPQTELVAALQAGDESAFAWLVGRHWPGMLRVATGMLGSEGLAAEVVQETWETLLQQLSGFRGEGSLRRWIYRILVRRAHRRRAKERRSVPFSALGRAEGERADPIDDFTAQGRWRSPVHGWRLVDPQSETLTREGLSLLARELEQLPQAQRVVVTLRDVEGLTGPEVCELLSISAANQRVLLHRGRTRLRKELERAEEEVVGTAGRS